MNDIAAMHYRVERIESDTLSMMRSVAWQVAAPMRGTPMIRPPVPDPNRPLVLQEADESEIRRNARGDLVRILDIEGNVVWWKEFRLRDSGVRRHSEIMDDLMKVTAAEFRRKYGIIPERPVGIAPPHAAPASSEETEVVAEPAPDPLGAWRDRISQSEGGANWTPRPDDSGTDWGEWGQR